MPLVYSMRCFIMFGIYVITSIFALIYLPIWLQTTRWVSVLMMWYEYQNNEPKPTKNFTSVMIELSCWMSLLMCLTVAILAAQAPVTRVICPSFTKSPEGTEISVWSNHIFTYNCGLIVFFSFYPSRVAECQETRN